MGDAEIPSVKSRLQKRIVELVDSGQTRAVEFLLPEYSELRLNSELLAECIYYEFCAREVRGQKPQFAEYLQRFPEHADWLRSQFQTHVTMRPPQRAPEEVPETGETDLPPTKPRVPDAQPVNPSRVTSNLELGPGSTLGPYSILVKLGQGGMGAVYKARHLYLDRIFAVKVLPRHLAQDADAVARFKREMRAVGLIDHPNIVGSSNADEVDGTLYLAMEYVEGSDLQALITQRGPMPVEEACGLLLQTTQAMVAAHGAGIVHRDLKPANLLLAKTGRIKVLDLGLARLAQDKSVAKELVSTEFTSAGQAFGTPDYMPPEQWDDAHSVDARGDLYSLGCVLFFLLVGRAPYTTGKYNSVPAKMKGHLVDPIPDLRAACPSKVPDAVVQIYERLLAKKPEDRLPTAAALAEALQPFVHDSAPEIQRTDGGLPVPPVPRRSSIGWWLAGTSLSLLVILLLLWPKTEAQPKLWFPEKLQTLGLKKSADSQRCRVRDRMFETQLVKTIAGKDVLFQLVPEYEIPKKDRKIRTFYIMEAPVSNALFNAFVTEALDFKEMVDREETQRTWKSGDDLPVVNVHPIEAQMFAQWFIPGFASLPTANEWDLASGYYDFIDLVKDQKSIVRFDAMLDGENPYTAAKFKVGTGPGLGDFQAAGKREPTRKRSPYGCLFPSTATSGLIEFGEITATARELDDGVENLREWVRDFNKDMLAEQLSTANCQLRMVIKRNKDFRWIVAEGEEAAGRCMTVDELDKMCGVLYLNTTQGGVGFNRNTGFRVVLLTTIPDKPEQ